MLAYDLYLNGSLRGCFTSKNLARNWCDIYVKKYPLTQTFHFHFKKIKISKFSHPENIEINPKI